jgi:hypothetical protein
MGGLRMDVPSKSHKAWMDIVTGKKLYALRFLAAKILLGRVIRSVSENPSLDNINASIEQLRNIYKKNIDTPSVQQDLKTIFGEEEPCNRTS